ncbi:MAG TPA: twin-arginine translocase subunit TatC [Planctomycetota bacterium]|nr:twin-arginine translocase subunit TatC [Planctomycetota bacterium]
MSTATQPTPAETTEVRMTFGEHLEELRWRLIKSIIAFGVAFVAAAVYYEKLLGIIVQPHFQAMRLLGVKDDQAKLLQLSYTGPVWALMKLSFIVALFVSSPIIAYQLWRFVSAGLYKDERKYVTRFAPVSFLLFAGGCAFGFYILIPYGLYGMGQMANDPNHTVLMFALTDYLNLVMTLTVVTGIIFQLPLIMVFTSVLGLTTAKTWLRWIRVAIVAIFVAAAVLTPSPDWLSQVLLAVPLLLLYLLGILLSALVARPRQRPARA